MDDWYIKKAVLTAFCSTIIYFLIGRYEKWKERRALLPAHVRNAGYWNDRRVDLIGIWSLRLMWSALIFGIGGGLFVAIDTGLKHPAQQPPSIVIPSETVAPPSVPSRPDDRR